jgi:hypothetical protein
MLVSHHVEKLMLTLLQLLSQLVLPLHVAHKSLMLLLLFMLLKLTLLSHLAYVFLSNTY